MKSVHRSRRYSRVHGPGAVLMLAAALWGCGGGGPDSIVTGCSAGDAVPASVAGAIGEAASTFYGRVGRGEWDAIYSASATAVQQTITSRDFLTPISTVFKGAGIPQDLQTQNLTVVHFGPDFPRDDNVDCVVEGHTQPRTLLLTDHVLQASLVQLGSVGPNTYYFSTLWHFEEEAWRLATFFAKPATLLGKNWEAYADEAAEERVQNRLRNSAILYNIAIDLVVPNAWTRPPELEGLRRGQRRISVANLPSGKPDYWTAGADTFAVTSVSYNVIDQGLGILFRFNANSALADTAAQARDGGKLMEIIREKFPEYKNCFETATLIAHDPVDRSKIWYRVYHFGDGS